MRGHQSDNNLLIPDIAGSHSHSHSADAEEEEGEDDNGDDGEAVKKEEGEKEARFASPVLRCPLCSIRLFLPALRGKFRLADVGRLDVLFPRPEDGKSRDCRA